ncbi:phage holin family protein [Williamsia sterculiae]|uniref:Putative Holin-X, holin superfamily III n=1 Tax=Williamsia sterculiae TaxID=1344003 RepID=A0A1N7F444_9NOCA|nr:phage holin family protein [Williamsia sterculiae]SIR95091.1 Putative Holin-X, holin superfamily III [Williamsia sterculiae]
MTLDDRSTGGVRRDVAAIPLSDPNLGPGGEPSIGSLVKDATANLSTLFRSELELAKAEVVAEGKKAAFGSVAGIIAGVIALYASLFFFVFLGVLLDIWLPAWAAFGIVFLILLFVAIIAGLVGFRFFKKITGPKKTIESAKELPQVLPGKSGKPDVDATKPATITR